jgi:hypothetical protein
MISWAVVGHEQRLIDATELANQLGAVVTIDDGSHGADANHLKAWDITSTLDSEWSCVIEDDALPVRGFTAQAEAALAVSPADVVSFYLGRGKPKRWQQRIPAALAAADRELAHWITSDYLLHAVAVAMRTELREPWLDWAPTSTLPIDERLGRWCRIQRLSIAYTTPSLVDHADGPTLVTHRDGQPRTMARTAWRTGTRGAWNSHSVSM